MFESDEALIVAVLAGRPRAHRCFVERVAPTVRSAVYAELRRRSPSGAAGFSGQDTEDLVQTVYSALFDRDGRLLRRWDPRRGALTTYLRWVARSRARDHLVPSCRQPWAQRATAPEDLDQLGVVPDVDECVAIDQAYRHALHQVADTATPNARRMLGLLFEDRLELDEICDRTDLSRDAVIQWRSRLRRTLRRAYSEACAA